MGVGHYLKRVDIFIEHEPWDHGQSGLGGALTVLYIVFVIVSGVFVVRSYVESTKVQYSNPSVLHQVYRVRIECISRSGCNITHRYDATGKCASQMPVPVNTVALVSTGAQVDVWVCYNTNEQDGVLLRTIQSTQAGSEDIYNIAVIRNQDAALPVFLQVFSGWVTQTVPLARDREYSKTLGKTVSDVWTLGKTPSLRRNDAYCNSIVVPAGHACGSFLFNIAPREYNLKTVQREGGFTRLGSWFGLLGFVYTGVLLAKLAFRRAKRKYWDGKQQSQQNSVDMSEQKDIV